MHPMTRVTSGNCRENKVGLSSDSRGLDRLGITKYDNAALVNRVVNVSAMMNHRGFLCFDKGRLALYGDIKGPVGPGRVSLSCLHSLEHQLPFIQVLDQSSAVLS